MKLVDIPSERTLLSMEPVDGDLALSQVLRPKTWDEYVGHERQKVLARRLLAAATARGEVPDHILLYGPPGLGKTVMADLIRNEREFSIAIQASIPLSQLQAVITTCRHGESIFIDEIHSLSLPGAESVQIGMEGGYVGLKKRPLPFMLLAATTKFGKLPDTLRDRFGLTLHLDYYPEPEIKEVCQRSAEKLNMELRPKSAEEIALRSRGVPRIANRLLRRVRDVTDDPKPAQVKKTLAELGVDSWGMDDGDRRLLMLLFDRFDGGPVGVRTLAAAAGHEERTLLEAFEPYLLRQQIIDVVPRGRQLTAKGQLYCQEVAKVS